MQVLINDPTVELGGYPSVNSTVGLAKEEWSKKYLAGQGNLFDFLFSSTPTTTSIYLLEWSEKYFNEFLFSSLKESAVMYDASLITIPYFFTTVAGLQNPPNKLTGESIYLSESLNEDSLEKLDSYKFLKDNWDYCESIAPTIEVIESAIDLVNKLNLWSKKIFYISPGPDGEIMIELRSGQTSIEFLIYPGKTNVVISRGIGRPTQSILTAKNFFDLLSELNDK